MKTVFVALILIAVEIVTFAGSGEEMFKGAERVETTNKTSGIHQYRLSNGKIVAFGPEIIIKVSKQNIISRLNKRYKPLDAEYLSDTLIMMTFSSGTKTLQLSKRISKEEGVLFAHPNLHMEKQLR